MPISLAGRTAIVTCTQQGIGRAVAQRLLDAGASVMVADADEKQAQSAEFTLNGEEDRWARFPYVAQDRLCIVNLLAATIDRFERIDILVNASRTPVPSSALLELEMGDFDAVFGDNVRGVLHLSQAFATRLIEQGGDAGGAIVNISSVSSQRAVPELLADSVSCAALDQLTRSMAAGLGPSGIRVNALALGGVLTEHLLDVFKENEPLRDEMIAATPLGRLAEVDEAANIVLFLASEHASYVTGQVLTVDGGRMLSDPLALAMR